MAGTLCSLVIRSARGPALFLLAFVALISIGVFVPAPSSWAAENQPALVLKPGQDSQRLGTYMEILEDPSAKLELAQVVAPGMSARFKPVGSDTLNLGVSPSAFWLRFRVWEPAEPKDRNEDGWYLDLGQPSLTYVTLYVKMSGQTGSQWRQLKLLSRDLKPFPQPSRYAVFRLPAQPGRAQTFYMRVHSTSVNSMAPRIYSLEGFLDHNRNLLWLLGAYCGAILALAIYNLVVFFSLRDRSYLWYVLTIVSLVLYYLGWNGLAQDYMRWLPDDLNRHLPIAFLSVLFLCRGQFARYFLLTKNNAPALDRAILVASLIMAFFTILVPTTWGVVRLTAIKMSALGAIVWPWLLLFIALRRWRQGFRPALYFVVVFPFTGITQLIFMLIILKVLPFSDLSFFSHQIASYFEPILLALALGYRIKSMRQEKQGAELAAKESETRYQLVMEAAPDPIAVCDAEGRFSYVNPAFERVFGWSASEASGKSLQEMSAKESGEFGDFALQPLSTGEIKTWETRLATSRGTGIDVGLSAAALSGPDGRPGDLVLIMQDITSRKRSEAEKAAYENRLRQLALELTTTEERERRRIAGDLHDGASQTLASSVFSLKRLRSRLTGDSQEELDRICTVMDQSLRDLRSLTFEISPPVLYDYGLAAALEWLASHNAQRHGLEVEFSEGGEPAELSQEQQVNLYRACRELLVNIVKHAGASKVVIGLDQADGKVTLSVADDGKGFDPEVIAQGAKSSMGLFSLRERLKPLGGTLSLQSEPGKGSRISLSLPLAAR